MQCDYKWFVNVGHPTSPNRPIILRGSALRGSMLKHLVRLATHIAVAASRKKLCNGAFPLEIVLEHDVPR